MELPTAEKATPKVKKSPAKKLRALEPELTGISDASPEGRNTAYETFNEVDARETLKVNTAPLTVFVAKHKGLRLKVRPLVVDSSDGEEYHKTATIGFSGGLFNTSDQGIIDALKRHANYGGAAGRQYADRPSGAREPLFWEGAYPSDVAAIRREEEEALTKDPEQYDPGSER